MANRIKWTIGIAGLAAALVMGGTLYFNVPQGFCLFGIGIVVGGILTGPITAIVATVVARRGAAHRTGRHNGNDQQSPVVVIAPPGYDAARPAAWPGFHTNAPLSAGRSFEIIGADDE